ncbi:MAG: hypothetical protein APF76_01215 [Desulfitibacter sp. BRH_c19]|nr:MAG: hypothetical protein APF76_01215 [Desulfitibacter sp. BRH_c19]
MNKVWYAPIQEANNEIMSDLIIKLHKEARFHEIFSVDDFTALKIHFGEKNNTGHIKPDWLKPYIDLLKETGCKPFLTDTNTLYKGQRDNTIDHLMQAYMHGFCIENLGIPIIISDGLLSKNYSEVKIPGNHFESVKIANDILHSNSMVVLSHLTGHILSGFGAAIKNLAMGTAPRSGKQVQHADVKPKVNPEKCTGCSICTQWCPKNAIEVYDGVARIDVESCYGCAECIATCRHDAIGHSFGNASKPLQEKMAEYALGAVSNKENKICYFNFLIHITKECDCMDKAQDKISNDIGILASYDPVAIDKASIDMLTKSANEDLLHKLWPNNDYNVQLDYAEKIGLGSKNYKLIEVR